MDIRIFDEHSGADGITSVCGRISLESGSRRFHWCSVYGKPAGPGHVGIVVKQSGPTAVSRTFRFRRVEYAIARSTRSYLVYPTCVQRAIWTSSPQEWLLINDGITFNRLRGFGSPLRLTCRTN